MFVGEIMNKYDLYDFDGTIYDGDSGIDLILFAMKKYPSMILKSLWNIILFLLKLISKEEFKSRIFSFVSKVDNIDDFVLEFWNKHEHKLKSFWLEKKSHKKDIIISASGRFWLEYIAKKYKVCDLIATEIDPKTGKVSGNNCHGKEKVKLFYDKYPKGKVNVMYTDSINDLPLIEEANEGYLVKGNKIYNYYEYKPNFIVRFWRWGWGIYHKNEELWNYIIVGGLTTFVSLGVKWLMWFTICDPSIENYYNQQLPVDVSWVVAVLFAYVANRIFVFRSKNKKVFKEFISFVSARVLTFVMEKGLTWVFLTLLSFNTGILVVIQTLIIQVLIMVLNYIFSKLFVFKK